VLNKFWIRHKGPDLTGSESATLAGIQCLVVDSEHFVVDLDLELDLPFHFSGFIFLNIPVGRYRKDPDMDRSRVCNQRYGFDFWGNCADPDADLKFVKVCCASGGCYLR